MRKWYNIIGAIIIIFYVALGVYVNIKYGIWEYGSAVVYYKTQNFITTHTMYPLFVNTDKLVYTWPYTPLSLLIFAGLYYMAGGNPIIFSLLTMMFFLATAIIVGKTASKIHRKDITLFAAGLFLTPLTITYYGYLPRVDTFGVFFLSLSLYYYIQKRKNLSIIFFLLAFLSKESYAFTLPLLFLFSGDRKNFMKTLLVIGGVFLIMSLTWQGFYQNVTGYMLHSTLRADAKMALMYTLEMIIFSGGVLLLYLGRHRKEYVYTAIVMFFVVAYSLMKPGSSNNYFYPLLILPILVGAGDLLTIKNARKIVSAVIIIIFIIQLTSIAFVSIASTKHTIIEKYHGKIFSGDTVFGNPHYDYFVLNVYASRGLWSWDQVISSITNQEYDYVILEYNYNGFFTQRVPYSVWRTAALYYNESTVFHGENIEVFVLTPKHQTTSKE